MLTFDTTMSRTGLLPSKNKTGHEPAADFSGQGGNKNAIERDVNFDGKKSELLLIASVAEPTGPSGLAPLPVDNGTVVCVVLHGMRAVNSIALPILLDLVLFCYLISFYLL